MLTSIKRQMQQALLISGTADFRTKKAIRDKEGHYTRIKGSILPRRHNA